MTLSPPSKRDASPAGSLWYRCVGTRGALLGLALALLVCRPAGGVSVEYPHAGGNDITCSACHVALGQVPFGYLPFTARNADDTPANNLCLSCHNDVEAPFVRTHSSLTTSARYGNWSMPCVTCHEPHQQPQSLTWTSQSYAATGTVLLAGPTTIQQAGAGWTTDQWAGWTVIGNITHPELKYRIVSNTADTLTVVGPVDLTAISPGSAFAIVYGRLIRASVSTPNSGAKAVKFFAPVGAHSFADGDATLDGICEVCHTQTTHFRNDGSGPEQHHANVGGADGRRCVDCHTHKMGFAHGSGSSGTAQGCGTATTCHGTVASHPTHVAGMQLAFECAECHDTSGFPRFKDGQDLAGTHICDNCHVAGVGLAKQYWRHPGSDTQTAGSWAVVEGERSFCGSCHNASAGNTRGDGSGSLAPNIVGDDATYGFYVTGHGKNTGDYARMSWQDTAASGNPAAAVPCRSCHELTSAHFGDPAKRLRAGYANDQANSNCKNCHSWNGSEGTAAAAPPHFYTTSAEYESGAHRDQMCTGCHDVHGATGPYTGMARADKQNLCYQCHADQAGGGVENDALSGAALADDIQQAFTLPFKHGLGTEFPQNGKTYRLQCTTCHNVHIVTGKYTQAAQGKSPVTRLSTITSLWGAATGQKMNDYAGSGTYQTPAGDLFAGAVLPDYATFCSDCHNGSAVIYSPSLARNLRALDWTTEKHGGSAANLSSYTMLAAPYQVAELGQYVLSCTDCHEAHGSTNNYAVRTRVNDGQVTVTQNGYGDGSREWDSLCLRCHGTASDVMYVHGNVWPDPNDCMSCHNFNPDPYTNCADCHSHGVDPYSMSTPTVVPVPTPTATP